MGTNRNFGDSLSIKRGWEEEEEWIVGGRVESLNVVLCTSHTHGMGMSSYGPPSERRYSDNCSGTGIRIGI